MELVSLARNPVPSGAVVGSFAGYDGAPLRYARWEATRSPRRGTVCLFHGRGEFIEKYFETIADLRRRGFAVATFDWRGQGRSVRLLPDRLKSHIEDFAEYDKDLVRFMKDVVLPDCPPPYIALAHSMGGNILLRAATERGSWFSHMVLSAPMIAFADEKVGFPQPLARAYAHVFSLLGMGSA
ncbi:MAG: alpha/beta hydrolase, partial [Hyphomicrobiaceae bacterium]